MCVYKKKVNFLLFFFLIIVNKAYTISFRMLITPPKKPTNFWFRSRVVDRVEKKKKKKK